MHVWTTVYGENVISMTPIHVKNFNIYCGYYSRCVQPSMHGP